MSKPWGKYEIDYLDHPKFRSLHANAIVLWHEAKNYCDKFHTDGRFQQDIARTFRFFSVKSAEQLVRSCGVKPNGDPYAPLWESQDIGGVAYYAMHDYLDYNDCREEVQKRIAKSKADADRKAAAQKAYRERHRLERDAERSRNVTDNVPDNATDNASGTEAERSAEVPVKQKQKQKQKQPPKEQEVLRPPRKERPQFENRRFAVHRWMVDRLISMLGVHADAFDLDEWLMTGAAARADEEVAVIPDWWQWLQAETIREAQRRGLPIAAPESLRLGKQTSRLMQAVANIHREAQ